MIILLLRAVATLAAGTKGAFPADWGALWQPVYTSAPAPAQVTRREGGVLDIDATPKKLAVFVGGERLYDCAVTLRVKFLRADDKYSGVSVYLRWGGRTWGERQGYWVYLRPKYRGLFMQKVQSGQLDTTFAKGVKAKRPKSTPLDEWLTLRCEARGRALKVFLNGKLCLSATDAGRIPIRSGRVAFGVSDAHVVIAEVKQTDLEQGAPLTGVRYRYINKPTRGDDGGTILTDGKVNPRRQQAFWRMLGPRPEIVFDLGKEFFLTRVMLSAISSPAVNISSAEVQASLDQQKWQTLAVIRNTDGRRSVLRYDIAGAVRGLARYVKIVLNRPAADQDVELAEVTFFGRTPAAADRETAAALTYDIGPPLPPTTNAARADDNYWYLTSRGIRVAVDRRHGMVGGVWRLVHRQKCLERLPDKYVLVTRKTETEADEYADEVFVASDTGLPSVLRLRCTNPTLPEVTFEKTYTLSADGRRLEKRVSFTSTSSASDRFLTPVTGGVLTEAFRKSGVYLGADRGLGARLFAAEVTVPRQLGALGARNAKVVLFQRYDLGWGVAQYRYKVNDRYCRPLTSRWHEKENHPPLYLPTGWEMGLCTLHLAPGEPRSVETHLAVYEGRPFDFYGLYRRLPDVAAAYDSVTRPAWVRDLSTSVSVALNPLTEDLTGPLLPVRRTLQMTDTGNLWLLSGIHGVWGDWVTKGIVTNGYGAKLDTRWLKNLFAAVHKLSPRIKTGVYTWAWAVHPRSRVFRLHPEWFIITDRNGQVFNAYSNMVLNHARRMSAPGSMDELLDEFARVMKDFGGDFFYLDGGGGGQNLIDWDHLSCDQDYDYEELYRRIRKLTRACGPDKAVWFNARTGPYWDIGYYEGVDQVLHEATWRESADGFAAVKMRQAYDPGQVVIPLYWRTSTMPFFSNYCLGLGITPSCPLGAAEQRRKLPYIEAAFETRGLRWLEADLKPDWRTDPRTQIEAFALRAGETAVLSVIDHRKADAKPVTLSADTRKLGLDPSRPVYVFTFGVRDVRKSWFALPESVRRRVYARTGWGLDLVGRLLGVNVIENPGTRVSVTVPTEPNLLRMVLLSNSPAGVYSVRGRRTNFWLSTNSGATVHAEVSARNSSMTVTSTAPAGGAEVIVCAPPGRRFGRTDESRRFLFVGNRRFVIVPVPAGKGRVVLPLESFGPARGTVHVSAPAELPAGKRLVLSLDPQPGASPVSVSVWRDEVLLGAKTMRAREGRVSLATPEEVHPGPVDVRVTVTDGGLAIGTTTVTLTGNYRPKLVPTEFPKRPPQVRVVRVDRVVNGVHVLQAGTDTHDGYDGGLFASADPDKLVIAGGNVDAPRSRYGYGFGGFELDNVRVLTLHLRSTFPGAWTFYRSRVSYHPQYTSTFAGMFVDYHGANGYRRRVALGCGLLNPKRKTGRPAWGANAAPQEFVALVDLVTKTADAVVTIDLKRWAPLDWDGRCWLSAGADNVLPSRRLSVQILGNSASPKGKQILTGKALGEATRLKRYTVARVAVPPRIDGRLDEDVWKRRSPAAGFTLLGRVNRSTQNTKAWLVYDDRNLYAAFDCEETEKKQPNTAAKKIWNQDAVDLALDVDGDRVDFQQLIVNAKGQCQQFTQHAGGKTMTWNVTAAAARHPGGWSVELAIPWSDIGVHPTSGMNWTGNFVRYRPYPPADEMMTWSYMPGPAINDPKQFGVLTFE